IASEYVMRGRQSVDEYYSILGFDRITLDFDQVLPERCGDRVHGYREPLVRNCHSSSVAKDFRCALLIDCDAMPTVRSRIKARRQRHLVSVDKCDPVLNLHRVTGKRDHALYVFIAGMPTTAI